MTDELIINIIVGLILIGAIFLIIRELICWYWKINERVAQGDEIIKQLQQLNLHNANLAINHIIDDSTRLDSDDC